jgi:transposase
MGKPYSLDLRERVVAAVKTGGLSCHEAAKQFGVGISTAINWVRRLRETGSVGPGKMGGHRPKLISGRQRIWLLQRIKEGEFTLRGLVAELAETRGEQTPTRLAILHSGTRSPAAPTAARAPSQAMLLRRQAA